MAPNSPPTLLDLCMQYFFNKPGFLPYLLMASFYIRTFGLANPGKAIEGLYFVPDALLNNLRDCAKRPNKIWKQGLYAITHLVYVGTQWHLERNIRTYKPSIVILVVDLNKERDLQFKRTLQEFARMRKQSDGATIYGELHINNSTNSRAWDDRKLKTLSGFYRIIMDIHVSKEPRTILFIEHTDPDLWQSFEGRSPDAAGFRGPKAFPAFAYAVAILHAACLYDISIERFLDQLNNWCPVSKYLVVRLGLQKIFNCWESVLDSFAQVHRFRLYDWRDSMPNMRPRPERQLIYHRRFVCEYLAKLGVVATESDYGLHLPLYERNLMKKQKQQQQQIQEQQQIQQQQIQQQLLDMGL